MADKGKDLPLVNVEKISSLISLYKFPLILAGMGVVLTVISLVILVRPSFNSPEIIFGEATGSAKTGGRIKVDVEGSVNKPGVYDFNEGERVSEAILIAGGLTEKADLDWMEKNLNRAAKLIDGGKIYIPEKTQNFPPQRDPASGGTNIKTQNQNLNLKSKNILGVTEGLININTATQTELEALPGVGPVTAGKIIDGRPYQTLEELKTKKAVGNALFEKIKDKLTV